jgi:hypothetical protein
MFRAVAPNRTLTELNVWFDNVFETDEAGPELADAIRFLLTQNGALQELSLFRLAPDQAAEILVNVIAALATENRSLSRLDLDLNEMSDSLRVLLPAMQDMLKHNSVFDTLVGFPFPEDDPVSTQVQFLLSQNLYGRRILMERPEQDGDGCDDGVSAGLWPKVLANISEDEEYGVMFQFLRAKPGMVRPYSGAVARSPGRVRR